MNLINVEIESKETAIKLLPLGDEDYEGSFYNEETYPKDIRGKIEEAYRRGFYSGQNNYRAYYDRLFSKGILVPTEDYAKTIDEKCRAITALKEIRVKSEDNLIAAIAERGLGVGKVGILSDNKKEKIK
jgi:hypothetical protein